ncbi:MAG TPA: nucleoside hydrolase [Candidatus Limnocylindria bacterium]|nr:nucleoside hydrolase [Candidatus Limnocylindria bacterium]
MSSGASARARRPVILDCDPGHDDALALLLALQRPELEVLGVTTVAGNATLENTTHNALSVLTLIERTDIPVAAGAEGPLRRPLQTAAHVHGASGLEGAELPAPASAPVAEHAVEFMAGLIEASAVPVTLVATGPLTNVALLRQQQPAAFAQVGHICLMGGAIGEGNITASAEFNIWVDPEAAAEVFEGGRPVTMIGLDVTHKAIVTHADADRLAQRGNRTGRVFADLLHFFARFHVQRYGWDGSPVHDAVAVAHVLQAGLVATAPYRVDVEVDSELTRGRTVVDIRGLSNRAPNAEVGLDIDRPRFVEMLIEAVASFP